MSAVLPVDPQKERQYAEWKARITGAGLPPELQPFVSGMQQMGEQEQAQSQAIEQRRQAETAPLQANVQTALGELDKEIQTPVEKKPIPENTAQHLDPKQLNEAASSWMALGALAGLLVRQPMTAALNNMTAAMQGVLQGDDEQFKSNFALWQKNFDAAMKVNNQMLAEKQKIIQDKSLSLSVKQEMLHLVDKKYDNEVAANQRYWKGQHDTYNSLMKATEMAMAAKERTQAAAQAHLDRLAIANMAHEDRVANARIRLTHGAAALTPEQNDALFGPNGAVTTGKLDPNRINSRTASLLADAFIANPNTDFAKLSSDIALMRNPTFRQRAMTAEVLPEIMRNMVESGKKLGYSDVQFVGRIEAWKNGQLNDPDFIEYMTQRNDALLSIASVMRGVGMTDQAHRAEIEVASPTMSPDALDAWLRGQSKSLLPRLRNYEKITRDKGAGGGGTSPVAGSSAAPPPGFKVLD